MTLKLNGSSSGSVSIDAPASTTGGADVALTLPVADGSANQYMKTDGSGNLGWVTPPTVPSAVILQAKCQSSTAGASSNSNSYAHFSGTDLAFTPTASDSTLILQVAFQAWCYRSSSGDGPIAYFQVSKDDNANYLLAPMLATGHHDTQVELYSSVASCMSESAGNTTARTYKLYYKLGRGTSMQINPGTGSTASITVWEVAA